MRPASDESYVVACIVLADRPATWVECIRDAPKMWSMDVEIKVSGKDLMRRRG